MDVRVLPVLLFVTSRALAQGEEPQPPDELEQAQQQLSELRGRVQAQQQQLQDLQTRVDQLTQANNQNADVLEGAVARQEAARKVEEARVGRIQRVDQLLEVAASVDLALMAGNRDVEDELDELEDGVRALQGESTQFSGREETDSYTAALFSLAQARQWLEWGDLFTVRGYVSGAAADIATARNSAAGNPGRAWSP